MKEYSIISVFVKKRNQKCFILFILFYFVVDRSHFGFKGVGLHAVIKCMQLCSQMLVTVRSKSNDSNFSTIALELLNKNNICIFRLSDLGRTVKNVIIQLHIKVNASNLFSKTRDQIIYHHFRKSKYA
jgi:hypothetical protein